MKFGLKKDIIDNINDVFKRHTQIEAVIIYGSRAKGNFKQGSDIDLTIKGHDLDLTMLNKISREIDDLLLPYYVDLSIYQHIDNPDLIDHINRAGNFFYNKPQ